MGSTADAVVALNLPIAWEILKILFFGLVSRLEELVKLPVLFTKSNFFATLFPEKRFLTLKNNLAEMTSFATGAPFLPTKKCFTLLSKYFST